MRSRVGFLVGVILMLVTGCTKTVYVASTAAPSTAAPTIAEAPTTKAPVPSETIGQQNARGKAESYLNSSSFSRSGLIDQLLYEGFSQAEAEYGVEAVGF